MPEKKKEKTPTAASESRTADGPVEIHLPDGTVVSSPSRHRKQERQSEDQNYVPVIIKRTDETRRHPDDALDNAIEDGLEQLNRPALSLWLSAIAAGLIVGFSAMAVAVVLAAIAEYQLSELMKRVVTAFVYPLGFVACILSGAQLFTEHTASALYPVLDREAGIGALLRLWLIVIVGNLLGAFGFALLLQSANEVVHAKDGFIEIGDHLTRFSTPGLLVSAVMAGWLMALGAWLVEASPRIIAQITVIYIVTFLIGLGGLHHSIAGSVEMFAAMRFSEDFTVPIAARFVCWALLGNLVGGSCFVALLNYAHIRRTYS